MKPYEILEHPADLKIRAFGKTKKELFFNTLKGMTESLKPEIGEMIAKRTIKISSPDLEALLIDFLNEVLYLIQTNKEIYTNINFKKLTNTPHQKKFGTGQAELEGELIGKEAKRFGEDIKAVTYYDLDIHQEKGFWEATVLFDI
jgi:SHS2 domain-containing protein